MTPLEEARRKIADHERGIGGVVLKPGEAAALLDVDRKTIGRWADDELIPAVKTPRGHRRYPAAALAAMIRE